MTNKGKSIVDIEVKVIDVHLALCVECARNQFGDGWGKVIKSSAENPPCGTTRAIINIDGVFRKLTQDLVDSNARWKCPKRAFLTGCISKTKQ